MSNVHDMTDNFDKAIARLSHVLDKPAFIIDAAVEVHDTLKLANISAKTIFGEDVSPEIAVKISDRLEAKRVLIVNEFEVTASERNQLNDAWLKSDVAAIDMAKSLGINIKPSDAYDDVRYLITKKLAENAGGAV
jgi:hypothetical protein